jgi:hypothetical protein
MVELRQSWPESHEEQDDELLSFMESRMTNSSPRTLDEQRTEFARNRFLAMPIAGAIAWSIVGIAGAFLPTGLAAWVLFIATGSIFGLGLVVARLIGEDLLGKTRPPKRSKTFRTPSASIWRRSSNRCGV